MTYKKAADNTNWICDECPTTTAPGASKIHNEQKQSVQRQGENKSVRHRLKVMQININGLRSKLPEVLMRADSEKIDVILASINMDDNTILFFRRDFNTAAAL